MMATKVKQKEPGKSVPIVAHVDVLVVGGGCSGVFAALAAAKSGAKTMLVERFGLLGGNAGPGLIFGCVDPFLEGLNHLPDGNQGLAKIFGQRLAALAQDIPPSRLNYASLFSYVALKMMSEYGVQLMLSAWAADPILENKAVAGLFVETKSGRVAVRSAVLIDATGDGDIAMRAGAGMVRGCPADDRYAPAIVERYDKSIRAQWSVNNWNEAGLVFVIAGIDWAPYRAFTASGNMVMPIGLARPKPGEQPTPVKTRFPEAVYRRLVDAAQADEFEFCRTIKPEAVLYWQYRMIQAGLDTAESAVTVLGDFYCDDWADITLLETEMRLMAWESVLFLKRHIPGFEKAWLLEQSPFIGTRGGPHIDGDITLTPADILAGARFDDVICRAVYETASLKKDGRFPQAENGYDIPYRMMLAKGLDGILVTGRATAYYRRGHDPATRGRIVQYRIGEVAGMAAAQAAHQDQPVRLLDRKALQNKLLLEDFFLGEPERLRQLGLYQPDRPV